MRMIEINNKTNSKIDLILVKKVIKKFLQFYKIKAGEVSIAFVGDKVARKLNKKYRGVDKVTDVLAFPGMESNSFKEDNYLGEIIINYAQIKRQARRFSNSIKEELVFILVHGLLHLLGYDDQTEKGREKMEKLGKKFIAKKKI